MQIQNKTQNELLEILHTGMLLDWWGCRPQADGTAVHQAPHPSSYLCNPRRCEHSDVAKLWTPSSPAIRERLGRQCKLVVYCNRIVQVYSAARFLSVGSPFDAWLAAPPCSLFLSSVSAPLLQAAEVAEPVFWREAKLFSYCHLTRPFLAIPRTKKG